MNTVRSNDEVMKTLVVGIGNLLRKDDGIGVHIIRRLRETYQDMLPPDVELVDGGTAGFDLLPLFMDRERIVIIDALRADDSAGSVYRFPVRHVAVGKSSGFQGRYNLPDLIFDLNLIGSDPKIEIIGVVPEDITSFEMELSDAVAESVDRVVDVIFRTIIDGNPIEVSAV